MKISFSPKQVNKSTEEKITCSQDYRGRELLGFSNYRMFEDLLQKHMATLKDPAIYLLNTIKGIGTHLHI